MQSTIDKKLVKKIIECTFKSKEQQNEIKKRIVFDFFDINDIKFLLLF